MEYPDYFDDFEVIALKDEPSKFLGVNRDGKIEISYLDIVKMAGHSCPTVGGAYLMALKGLKALYPEGLPERGEIKVELRKSPTEDNTGVDGSVFANITGATTDYGFGGLVAGKFSRRNLMFYNAPIDTDVRFTRLDTKKQIGVNYYPGKVVNPGALLMSAIGPNATAEDIKAFPDRFQSMVKTLFENGDVVIEVMEQ